jgi:hypothetical protein
MNMRPLRTVSTLALGAALVAVAAASRTPSGSLSTVNDVRAVAAEPIDGPVGHATGAGAAPLPLPSIVGNKVIRTGGSLARATALVDQGQSSQAAVELSSAVLNMQKAWTAAWYVVQNAPPPPPPGSAGGMQAHASGGAVGGATAAPEDTAFAVLSLQHDVIVTALGLIDGADATLAPSLDSTITAAMTDRNTAINAIHSVTPPPPPPGSVGGVQASASGAPVGSTWDTVMQGLLPILDDEIQNATGTLAAVPTSPIDLQKVVQGATDAKNMVAQFWPPPPPAG